MVGRLELQDDFKEQAEWRREKAEQYPDDKRHLEAAAIFDRLAATVDGIPQDVFRAFSQIRRERWPTGRRTVDRDAARRWLWLVTENCRGLRPIFYRGSNDAARITRRHGCSPLSVAPLVCRRIGRCFPDQSLIGTTALFGAMGAGDGAVSAGRGRGNGGGKAVGE